MATFDFHTDEKRTIWYRKYFTIEAETLEDAKKKAIELEDSNQWIDNCDYETLYDTSEGLPVSENDGWPTKELFAQGEDDKLWDNT